MIKIYYTRCERKLSDVVFQHYLDLLPLVIKNKILKFRRWQDAQASLFGKLLLINAGEDLSLDIDLTQLKYTAFGRPYLENNFDFNISHSNQYVVCAISTDAKIGVDIEKIKPITLLDFKDHFFVEEWNAIINSNDLYHIFYEYWTAKEAILKAEGSGLNISLKDILIKEGKSVLGSTLWYYESLPLFKDCVMHLASDKKLKDASIETKYLEY